MADNSFLTDPSIIAKEMSKGVAPSAGRRFEYGMARSTWLGGELWRMGKAAFQPGDYRENIERLEQERLSKVKERFSDISEEDATSTAALWGEGIGTMFDPAMFGTLYLATPLKAQALTRIGIRARSAGIFGAEGAVRGVSYQSSRGHDVDPTHVAINTLLGTAFGGILPMRGQRSALFGRGPTKEAVKEAPPPTGGRFRGTLGPQRVARPTPTRRGAGPRGTGGGVEPTERFRRTADKVARLTPRTRVQPGERLGNTNASRIKDPVLSPAQEKNIEESLLRALENPDMPESILKNLIDVPNIAALLVRRDVLKNQLDRETKRRINKQVGALSDSSFAKLKNKYNRTDKALEKLGRNPYELAIKDITTGVLTGIKQLDNDGLLTAASIRRAMIRPIIGVVGGYGTGATANLYSEEDDFSPSMFAAIGFIAAATSGKIVNSTYTPLIKKAVVDASQDLIKISNFAHANVMFSATSATRLNSFGGLSELFSRTLFNQAGADLRGAAITSVEARQALIMQEINHIRRIKLENQRLGDVKFSMLGSNKDVVRLREASGKYLRGVYGKTFIEAREGLEKAGFNAEEITLIFNASGSMRRQIKKLWEVFTDVLPDLKKVDDYGLPQFHNYNKIFKDQAGAREAYGEAFYQQALSKKSVGGLSERALDRIRESAQRKADKFVDDIITTGSPNPASSRSWSVGGDLDYSSSQLRMAPLIKNLEFDRKLTDIKAIREIEDFMVWDVDEVMSRYVQLTVPTIEFARTFGAKGELILALKKSMKSQFENSRAGASTAEKRALNRLEKKQMKAIHDSVDMYFGRLHSTSTGASSPLANNVYAVATTLANLTYLPKVTISSLGDLVQPFQNSGVYAGIKGMARTASKDKKVGFHNHSFGNVDVMSHELQAYTMKSNIPGSSLQAFAYGTNQKWFQLIGLAKLTSFARKFAYNTGIEDGFTIAKKLAGKRTDALTLRANNLGIDDDIAKHLQKFKTVEDAWEDKLGQTYLNRIGKKASDRDALIPQIGNRRGFTQSRDPAIRATGQFLSWAQAKSAQTNSLIQRMEAGDAALAVRMLGTLVIYDGILTFRDFLNDPTGKRLDKEGVQSYKDSYLRLKTMGRASQFSANTTHWFFDKLAGLMSTRNRDAPLTTVAPSLGWIWDMITGFVPVPITGNYGTVFTNIARDDPEGALVQTLKRLPLGDEYMALRDALGIGFIDEPSPKDKRYTRKAKGGIVKDVPGVPEEPDERIDKMTGLPYNVQAGTAFIDEEDPEKREAFILGGLANILRPLFSKSASFPLQHLIKETAGVRDRWASAKILSGLKPSSRKTSPPKASEVSPEAPSSAGEDLARLQVAEEAARLAKDDLGFVSPTIEAMILRAPPSLKGNQITQWLKKNTGKGVKPKELEFLGVDEFIANNPNATMQEVAEGVAGNKVKVSKQVTRHSDEAPIEFDVTVPETHPVTGANLEDYEMVEAVGEGIPSGTFAFGNDSDGYQLFVGGKRVTGVDPPIGVHGGDVPYSRTEAQIQLRQAIDDERHYLRLEGEEDISGGTQWKGEVDKSLPGGKNYSEVVFQWENAPVEHNISHSIGDPNIPTPKAIAHALVRDRKLADGSTSKHVDELQSDLHTEGSKKGYQLSRGGELEVINKIEKILEDTPVSYAERGAEKGILVPDAVGAEPTFISFDGVLDANDTGIAGLTYIGFLESVGHPAYPGLNRQLMDRRAIFLSNAEGAAAHYDPRLLINANIFRAMESLGANNAKKLLKISKPFTKKVTELTPNYPFKDDYHEMVIKNLVLDAINEGKDAFSVSGSAPIKARYNEKYNTFFETLYDKKIPSAMKKLANKYGGKFEEGRLDLANTFGEMGTASNMLSQWTENRGIIIPTVAEQLENATASIIKITPEMKEKILAEGLRTFGFAKGGLVNAGIEMPENYQAHEELQKQKVLSKDFTK